MPLYFIPSPSFEAFPMEFLVLLLLILVNGLFAMSEIAVVSARNARLQQWADEGKAGAGVALELAAEPGHFLAAIQVGITLIGILNGAFGEATVAASLAGRIAQVPVLVPYSATIAMADAPALESCLSPRPVPEHPDGVGAEAPRPSPDPGASGHGGGY
jgi:putative hemolysin